MNTPLTSTDTIVPCLADNPGTKENPAYLTMKVNISSESEWNNLLAEIWSAGKYVDLDLGECPMEDGTKFGFPALNTTEDGKDLIVSITLPDTAAGIRNGYKEYADIIVSMGD